jgi:hypothetical protein
MRFKREMMIFLTGIAFVYGLITLLKGSFS